MIISNKIKQEAAVVGAVASLIVGAALAWWLSSVRETWDLGSFLILAAAIAVACLLIGLWLDKRNVGK